MISFDFGTTADNRQKRLKPNEIHTVHFDGCEARDITSTSDPERKFKVLDIKFSNDEGTFTHTIFEPTEADLTRSQNQWGEGASNFESMMLLLKHLIDAVNPVLGNKINKKEASLKAPNWDALRQLMVKATESGKGTEVQIKLLGKVNKNGYNEAVFPRYFARVYDGVARLVNPFIGKGLTFTAAEMKRIQETQNAQPKPVETIPYVTDNVQGGEAPKKDDPFSDWGNMPF